MHVPLAAEAAGPIIPAPRDDLCLDFANTRYWRGSTPATETLHTAADLLNWSAAAGGIGPPAVEHLRQVWQARTDEADMAFAHALAVREAIYAVFTALTAGEEPAADLILVLNEALQQAPARGRLDHVGGRFVWRVAGDVDRDTLLAPTLWSAGDLLTGGRLDRVRRCANERCGWLFLDDSKSANRRWCSMSQCGNRAKAHRHYAKRRKVDK